MRDCAVRRDARLAVFLQQAPQQRLTLLRGRHAPRRVRKFDFPGQADLVRLEGLEAKHCLVEQHAKRPHVVRARSHHHPVLEHHLWREVAKGPHDAELLARFTVFVVREVNRQSEVDQHSSGRILG